MQLYRKQVLCKEMLALVRWGSLIDIQGFLAVSENSCWKRVSLGARKLYQLLFACR